MLFGRSQSRTVYSPERSSFGGLTEQNLRAGIEDERPGCVPKD